MKNLRGYDQEDPAYARHYVKVPAPAQHAGVGAALRQAFHMNGESRGLESFEDLLKRLD